MLSELKPNVMSIYREKDHFIDRIFLIARSLSENRGPTVEKLNSAIFTHDFR